MLRAAAITLVLAVLASIATSVVWLRSTAPLRRELRYDPNAVIADFERSHPPLRQIDLGTRASGRLELLDPRLVLPTWHLHPRKQAASVFAATRHCPPTPLTGEVDDAALKKAYEWHAATCAAGSVSPTWFADEAPLLHPSGHSYAALTIARGDVPASFAKSHLRSLHVIEQSRDRRRRLRHQAGRTARAPRAAQGSTKAGPRHRGNRVRAMDAAARRRRGWRAACSSSFRCYYRLCRRRP